MPELTDAQKVNREVTQKRIATALEALAGTGGRGLPAGGTDGDVLVKNGATDYDATWKKTPPQMGSLATIEPTSTVTQKQLYHQGDYLVYNGQLYVVTAQTISIGTTLTPGGNIRATSYGDAFSYEEATGIQVLKNIDQQAVSAFKANGIVTVDLRTWTTGTTKTYISAAEPVFNLPEGFRPRKAVRLPAACTQKTYAELGADFNEVNAFVSITDSGNVFIGASTNYTQVFVCGSYPVL